MDLKKDKVDIPQISEEYPHGFEIEIEQELLPAGLNEKIITEISKKKDEPEWMLEFRLRAYRAWQKMEEPHWAKVHYQPINYQDISYYAAPKKKYKSLDDIEPEIKRAFERLGIPLEEQKMLAGVAVDAVLDSVSIASIANQKLSELGIIFCSIGEAIKKYPDLVKKYLGTVVPITDNFYAALNSAVFSDGTFVYIPKGVKCPVELSTYFRINARKTGQFERTLIIADEDSYVSYLEGCTAPMRDENQLHAAVVELIAHKNAEIRYSTVQNWYYGDDEGKGGVFNFVTKRGICLGENSFIRWTQVETGSAITWKYPSCILKGKGSRGEFFSVAITRKKQQADTGTKMIHLAPYTSSSIISKGISAGHSSNTYRGLVKISPNAFYAKNYTRCDSLLIGNNCSANTFPYVESQNSTAILQHEATTSRIGEEQFFYCMQRGLNPDKAVSLIIHGFCKEVLNNLPFEFAVEASKLLEITLEGSVG